MYDPNMLSGASFSAVSGLNSSDCCFSNDVQQRWVNSPGMQSRLWASRLTINLHQITIESAVIQNAAVLVGQLSHCESTRLVKGAINQRLKLGFLQNNMSIYLKYRLR